MTHHGTGTTAGTILSRVVQSRIADGTPIVEAITATDVRRARLCVRSRWGLRTRRHISIRETAPDGPTDLRALCLEILRHDDRARAARSPDTATQWSRADREDWQRTRDEIALEIARCLVSHVGLAWWEICDQDDARGGTHPAA